MTVSHSHLIKWFLNYKKYMCSDPVRRNWKVFKCNAIHFHSFDALWLFRYFGFWFQQLLFLFCFKFYAIDWPFYMEITAAGFKYKNVFYSKIFHFHFEVSTLQINKMRNKSHKNQDVLYCHKIICSQQTVFHYGEYDAIKILSSAEKDICYALFVTSPFRYNLDI